MAGPTMDRLLSGGSGGGSPMDRAKRTLCAMKKLQNTFFLLISFQGAVMTTEMAVGEDS